MNRSHLLIVLLACFALIACGGEPPRASKTTIAVIPKGTTHEFWKSIHAGAVKAQRELDLEIIWKGPLKEDNREDQIALVETFIARGVSGIVLAPLDDTALRVPVANAVRNGIPVVIIDSGLQSADFVSFVATDNYQGGRMAGMHMAQRLNRAGEVIVLRYQEGSASTAKREQGFLDAIGEYAGIEIASSNQHGGATTESAYRASENLLAPFKDASGKLAVQGIFCPNESTTFGMLRALQDAGLAGSVIFIGFDSSEKLVEALQNDQIHALVLQNPFKMGYLGVMTMAAHLAHQPVEKRIDTGVALVTKDNMNDPDINSVLTPDLDKWLRGER